MYGLPNVTSITIVGNSHTLVADQTRMPPFIDVKELSLKGLTLNDQILYNIAKLQTYSIEECTYGQNSKILHASPPVNVVLVMKSNNPVDSVLPFRNRAFGNGTNLIGLTLIEPRLNATSLQAVKRVTWPGIVFIRLGAYNREDMSNWKETAKPVLTDLTIENIPTLDIFPSGFFNGFTGINQLTLRGSFELEKSAICIFVAINKQERNFNTNVTLDSPFSRSSDDWNNCADTYVKAINYESMKNIECPSPNSYEACQKWASDTEKCNLISYENSCSVKSERPSNNFFYNGSSLYYFFQRKLWLNSTAYPSIPKQDSINIGAIIGAVCGLVVAAIILGLTIYCIRRNRRKHRSENVAAPQIQQYKPSSHDKTHVSIATSKSSESSRYALEHSFFPVVQSKDEIAPPLYTAPSESVGAHSTYNGPSAPPAPRDSISTRATHVYETLDS